MYFQFLRFNFVASFFVLILMKKKTLPSTVLERILKLESNSIYGLDGIRKSFGPNQNFRLVRLVTRAIPIEFTTHHKLQHITNYLQTSNILNPGNDLKNRVNRIIT